MPAQGLARVPCVHHILFQFRQLRLSRVLRLRTSMTVITISELTDQSSPRGARHCFGRFHHDDHDMQILWPGGDANNIPIEYREEFISQNPTRKTPTRDLGEEKSKDESSQR